MHVFHPPQSVNGLPPENTFYVADSANMTVADGFLIPTYHPYLFPDRPINLFMSIRSKGPGRDMLMGARWPVRSSSGSRPLNGPRGCLRRSARRIRR